MVLAGASLVDAVRCASLNPATVIGMDKSLGSIEPGKLADIVLLTEDVMPVFTLVNGRVAYDKRPPNEGAPTCQSMPT
jgi:N-acetylglucosamine-6-phosphate deacetylase